MILRLRARLESRQVFFGRVSAGETPVAVLSHVARPSVGKNERSQTSRASFVIVFRRIFILSSLTSKSGLCQNFVHSILFFFFAVCLFQNKLVVAF